MALKTSDVEVDNMTKNQFADKTYQTCNIKKVEFRLETPI